MRCFINLTPQLATGRSFFASPGRRAAAVEDRDISHGQVRCRSRMQKWKHDTQTEMPPVDVFISSSCYDLTDLRAELGAHLQNHSFLVRLSDEYNSNFKVNGSVDSIASCLLNVEAADVVVLILDRRYGPILKDGPYAGLSATHAEIQHALTLLPEERRKPIFTFVRNQSVDDHERVLLDHSYDAKWIDDKNKDKLTNLIAEMKRYASAVKAKRSNWFDAFKSSADLKPLVLKRLLDQFPHHVGAFARQPERIVRLFFQSRGTGSTGETSGVFVNAGNGPALDIEVGWHADGKDNARGSQGGLTVGARVPEKEGAALRFSIPPNKIRDCHIYCMYQNVSGDLFRVEVPLTWSSGYHAQKELFKILIGTEWLKI